MDRPRRSQLARRGALAVLLLAVAAELGFRLFQGPLATERISRARAWVGRGEAGKFQPWPHTLFRRADGPWGINQDAFLDADWAVERTPGVPRILCLGASTTESGNSALTPGSFPYLLERELEERTGRDFEVYNAGMSGWTTAETLVFWFLRGKDLRPDLVILHHAVNDAGPRMWPEYRSDYSHYRRPWQAPDHPFPHRWLTAGSDLYAWLVPGRSLPTLTDVVTLPSGGTSTFRDGRFPDGTERAFRRNLISIADDVRASGGRVLLATLPHDPAADREDDPSSRPWRVGIREHNDILRAMSKTRGHLLADLARWAAANAETAEAVFEDLVHMSPAGNQGKAILLADVLMEQWVPELP